MYLSGPAGWSDRTHSVPSGADAAATMLADPGICVKFSDDTGTFGCTGDCISPGGKISVCAIGAGVMSAGETDFGVTSPGEDAPGGKPEPPCEHAAAKASNSNPQKASLRMIGTFQAGTEPPPS